MAGSLCCGVLTRVRSSASCSFCLSRACSRTSSSSAFSCCFLTSWCFSTAARSLRSSSLSSASYFSLRRLTLPTEQEGEEQVVVSGGEPVEEHAPVVSGALTLLFVLGHLLLQRPDRQLDLFVAFFSQLLLAAQQPRFLWTTPRLFLNPDMSTLPIHV